MFFCATLLDNVAFLQQTYIKKKSKKKREKEVKCQTGLAEGDNHACVSIVVLLMSELCKTLEYEFLDPPNASVVQQAQCRTGLQLSSI